VTAPGTGTADVAADEARLRDESAEVGASLHARGCTTGMAGNISARLADGWFVTPTDACLGRLDPARLWLMSTPRPAPLTATQVGELEAAFGVRW
jgi:hypothetical protein